MSDEKYKVTIVPMVEVFSDDSFNCRGRIIPFDVKDLAEDIAKRGLDFPIIVTPFSDPTRPQFKYKIAAGHRRHLAMKVNKVSEIPVMIRTDLTEATARLLNLTENLKRKDLNIIQEAHALEWFKNQNWLEETIAARLGASRGWVQIRLILLKMPKDIQDVAAAGLLNQAQIRNLFSMKSDEERYAAIRKIKDAKERGEKADITPVKKPKPHEKRERTFAEMLALQDYIQEQVGNNLATRLLGWAAGYVSTLEIHRDLREFALTQKKVYRIPKDITDEL